MKTKSRAGKARTKNGPSKRVGSGRLVRGFRPQAIRDFNKMADALSGQPEIKRLTEALDRYHRLAADARAMLYNGGYGPNLSQRERIDKILREIAGLPPSPNVAYQPRGNSTTEHQ